MNVLFVCTGNTCRSPMAEYMLRRLLSDRGIEGIEVALAGIGATVGAPASEGSYLVGLEHGLDLSPHRARQLRPALARDADLVLTMGRAHRTRAIELGAGDRVHLLGEYVGRSGSSAEVADPFGGELEDYRDTWRQLESLLADLVDRLPSRPAR